jgi:GNAT superfamily N-acetyltransferase
VLRTLAEEEEDFGLAEGGGPREPISGEDAEAYLGDPAVLHWVAEEEGAVVGHLLCYVERRRTGVPKQLLLYDIGVRRARRRRGIGSALVGAMRAWMREEGVVEAWVLADNPGAESFYSACGFARDDDQPVQMTLTV